MHQRVPRTAEPAHQLHHQPGRLHRGVESRAHVVAAGCAGGDDAGEHEGREVAQIARAELHADVLEGEPVEECHHGRGRVGRVAARRAERPVAGGAVGGDGDVHDHVADADLVDVVAERPELGDQLGLERTEGARSYRALAERPPQRVEVEEPGIHLVVRELRQQAPLRDLGSAQAGGGCRTLERQLGPAEQTAHARQVRLERRRAHVQRVGRIEDVDAVGRIEQSPHQRVQSVSGCTGIGSGDRAQSRGRVAARAVAERARLDRRPAGDAGVHGRDVGADAARGDPQGVGQRRRGRPFPLAQQQGQKAVLASLRRHGPSSAPPRWAASVPSNHATRDGGSDGTASGLGADLFIAFSPAKSAEVS